MVWREDEDPGLPIDFGPCSNGEYDPVPLSAVVREAIRRARAQCEDNARWTRTTRRQFLLGVCGAATTLLALSACDREASEGEPGGRYAIPPEGTTEPDAAREAVGGEEFVLDVQGHLLDYDVNPAARRAPFFGAGFPQARCGEADPRDCFSIEHFLEEIFLKSDTTMVVLSSIPVAGDANPLTIEVMEQTRRVAQALCGDGRVVLHGQAVPNIGRLEASLDAMEDLARDHRIAAWKVYTHAPGGRGWWLDDHEPGALRVGEAFIAKAVEVGVPTICVHKGFSGGSRFASPEDIGRAARDHPDVRFVVDHSGYEAGQAEAAYTPATADVGVNRLITSLLRHGIGPNQNVYAELGSTWWNVMRSPTEAAHVVGKLLRHVGEDNVLWGTDSIWYGSPQGQIQAFRAFEITEGLRERHGYPELTDEVKRKVLGLNAARLHGVDPVTARCSFTHRELEEIRKTLPGRTQAYGPRTSAQVRELIASHGGLL